MTRVPRQFEPGLVGWWDIRRAAAGETVRNGSRYGQSLDAALENMDPGTDRVMTGRGWGLDLDGTNDWLSVPDLKALQITGPITLAIEIQFTDLAGDDGGLISKSKAAGKWFSNAATKVYELGILNDTCWFQVSDGSTANNATSGTAALEDGAWHQIVGTWDGSNAADAMKLYFDAALVDTSAGTIAAIQTSTDLLAIGGYNTAYPFRGVLGFAGVWRTALAPSTIHALQTYLRKRPRRHRAPWFVRPSPRALRPSRHAHVPTPGPPSRTVCEPAFRAKYFCGARGRYRVFNAAEYRFYRDNSAPPAEDDAPFATSSTLPATPADAFANGTWYISCSYFNGVLDSGFLPLGPRGETYLRLDLAAGAVSGSPPAAPMDWRLEVRPGGVIRIHALYFQSDAALRAGQWSIAYTVDGSNPAADAPDNTKAIAAAGLAILQYDLPAQGDGTTVKVRLQTRRDDGSWVYSENSTIKTAVASTGSATAPTGADRWPGRVGSEE